MLNDHMPIIQLIIILNKTNTMQSEDDEEEYDEDDKEPDNISLDISQENITSQRSVGRPKHKE